MSCFDSTQTPAPRIRRAARKSVEAFGIAALAAYCAWWAYWLARGKLPSAPLLAITGFPAPSTGCVRSLQSLLAGHIAMSLRWNPFALPLTLLFLLSIAILLGQALGRAYW